MANPGITKESFNRKKNFFLIKEEKKQVPMSDIMTRKDILLMM